MEHIALEAEPRPPMSKGRLKQLRRGGKVPAVVYGRGKDNQNLQVDGRRLNQILSAEGSNVLLSLQLAAEADGSETVMLREIQRNPILKEQILHVDFIRISMTDQIEVEVPLNYFGESEAIKEEGAVLEILLREITLKCLPAEIPENIPVDVSNLVNIGDGISAGELDLGEKLELVTDPDELLVQVSVVEEEEEEEEEEEALELELEDGEEVPEEAVEAEPEEEDSAS